MFNQIELFFVDPSVMSASHQILMGHFTSNENFKNEGCFDLGIKTDGETIKEIKPLSEISYGNEVFNENSTSGMKPELKFIYSPSLNSLMSNKKLKCYTTENENHLIIQVCILQVCSLNKDDYSYLFFGFVKNEIVSKIHSKVFFTDKNGEIHLGGDAKHKMGNNITADFTYNYAFGFGKNLALTTTSSKEYLEGLHKYKKIIVSSNENIDKETLKDLNVVFGFCDEEYFKFLKLFTELLKENDLPENLNFWATKDYSEKIEMITKKAVEKMMKF